MCYTCKNLAIPRKTTCAILMLLCLKSNVLLKLPRCAEIAMVPVQKRAVGAFFKHEKCKIGLHSYLRIHSHKPQAMISQEGTQRAFLPVLEPYQVANAKKVCTAW